MSGAVDIRQATDRRGRKQFLQLPFDLYRNDPNWTPPLRSAQAKLFAGKTAFFAHAEMALFLAERSGRVVGRVAAIRNTAHNAHYGDGVGFFGFFECAPDDTEAAIALMGRVERWLIERGLDVMRGPVNPSMNAECGVLIEGFDRPPMALMPYNPAAYGALMAAAGMVKCKDLYAYLVFPNQLGPGSPEHDRTIRLTRALTRRYPGLKLRPIDMRKYEQEISRFMEVFEEARRNNWGYVPVAEAEMLELAREMKAIIDPKIIVLAEVDGKPAGTSLGIPNINRGLAACKGRLFPFGFLRFFRAMKRVREARFFGLAALEEYRHKGITVLLLLESMRHCREIGYDTSEASWVLEDNEMSKRTIEHGLNGKRYKTYRIYDKHLAPAGALPPPL